MYIGVDIGGTKTLIAALTDKGVVKEEVKILTPHLYEEFLAELEKTLATFKNQDFRAAGVAVPGKLNRHNGTASALGNRPWKNIAIQADCEKIFHAPVVIENDANLAALSEAMLHKDYETVLYVTVSTGIGTGFVANGRLVPSVLDSEGGHMLLPYKGRLVSWENFASGRAIYEHFDKKASDIHDDASWKFIAHNLSLGLFQLIAVLQPKLIIIGGSVGTYFERYEQFLVAALKQYEVPVVAIPPVVKAQRPEEAVVYGCYDLAKQFYGNH